MRPWIVAVVLVAACRSGSPAREQSEQRSPRDARPVAVADAAPISLAGFELEITCAFHGTGITRETTRVTDRPPSIVVTGDGVPPSRDVELTDVQLEPLRRLLGDPAFVAWTGETPAASPAHPGMRICDLTFRAGDTDASMRWTRGDGFSTAGADVERRLFEELGRLRAVASAAPPPSCGGVAAEACPAGLECVYPQDLSDDEVSSGGTCAPPGAEGTLCAAQACASGLSCRDVRGQRRCRR